jgi:hypothetical protein
VKEGHDGHTTLLQCEAPIGYKSWLQHKSSPSSAQRPTSSVAQQDALTAKRKSKAMAIAMKPGQQILMNAFMMYMSGSQLNIFSINICSSAIMSPLTNIFAINQQFSALQKVDLTTAKMIFLALNLVWLGIGLYKMSTMRLLPTTSADFIYKIGWKEMLETTSIPPDNLIML